MFFFSIRILKLVNTDKFSRHYGELASSVPFTDVTHFDFTPRTSLNDGYECTPIASMTSCYENTHEKEKRTTTSKTRSRKV